MEEYQDRFGGRTAKPIAIRLRGDIDDIRLDGT
jgi:hypothetical protein